MSRVIIYHRRTGEVVENMGPMSSSAALRVLRGSRINLNTEDYWSTEVGDDFKGKVYPPSKAKEKR